MNRNRWAFATAAAMAAAPGLAKADVIVQQSAFQNWNFWDTNDPNSNPNNYASFNRFDPSIGSLNFVVAKMKMSFSTATAIENMSNADATFSGGLTFADFWDYNDFGGGFGFAGIFGQALVNYTLPAFDGALDYKGSSALAFSDLFPSYTHEYTQYMDADYLSNYGITGFIQNNFVGSDAVTLRFSLQNASVVNDPHISLYKPTGEKFDFDFELTYDYTPAPAPAAVPLLVVAGLMTLRRKR